VPAEESRLEIEQRFARPGFELDVATSIPLEGVTGLTGPNGAGKSTFLALVAGFEKGEGAIRCAGETWADSRTGRVLPAHRRPVGTLFQDGRLFSHLDVAGNLRYAERRAEGGPRFDEVAAALDLDPLFDRRIDALSGGERQRVALGRTLLSGPRLLLLDEPLASLDVARKREILDYLESVLARFSLPAIYVSHSVDEILRLAERVILLEAGRVRAEGPTAAVFNDPRGDANGPSVLEARIASQLPDLGLTELDFEGQAVFVPQLRDRERGRLVRLRVDAEDVAIATERPAASSFRNVLEGRIEDVVTLPGSAFAVATVRVGGARLRCHLTRQAVVELELVAGMHCWALLKTASFESSLAR